MSRTQPIKEPQRVDASGEPVGPRIHGMEFVPAVPQVDIRGEVCEIWTEARDPLGAPVVHAYMATVRPGKVRGWNVHLKQDDRIFIQFGRLRWAFYDARPGSPTEGLLDVLTFSDRRRMTFAIPAGVWHGAQNVGDTEASFINLPTRAYDHEDPDRLRLPLVNDLIPFAFEDVAGW